MCPAFLRFTFIQRSLVTQASCGYTAVEFVTLTVKAVPCQQSTTLQHSAFLFVNVNSIMQPFYSHLLLFFDLWVHFVVCCSFCAVAYIKKDIFYLCK